MSRSILAVILGFLVLAAGWSVLNSIPAAPAPGVVEAVRERAGRSLAQVAEVRVYWHPGGYWAVAIGTVHGGPETGTPARTTYLVSADGRTLRETAFTIGSARGVPGYLATLVLVVAASLFVAFRLIPRVFGYKCPACLPLARLLRFTETTLFGAGTLDADGFALPPISLETFSCNECRYRWQRLAVPGHFRSGGLLAHDLAEGVALATVAGGPFGRFLVAYAERRRSAEEAADTVLTYDDWRRLFSELKARHEEPPEVPPPAGPFGLHPRRFDAPPPPRRAGTGGASERAGTGGAPHRDRRP